LIFGIVKFPKLRPKKENTILIIKYAKKTITKPTNAATIVFLAPSTAVLSPPDVIHLIPPKIRKPRAIRVAIIKAIVIRALTTPPPKFRLQRILNPAFPDLAHGSIVVVAKAGAAVPRKAKEEIIYG